MERGTKKRHLPGFFCSKRLIEMCKIIFTFVNICEKTLAAAAAARDPAEIKKITFVELKLIFYLHK